MNDSNLKYPYLEDVEVLPEFIPANTLMDMLLIDRMDENSEEAIFNFICEMIDKEQISALHVALLITQAKYKRYYNFQIYVNLFTKLKSKYDINGYECDHLNELFHNYHWDNYKKIYFHVANEDYELLLNIGNTNVALCCAAELGCIKVYKYLLLNGAERTNEAMEWAIAGGNVEIIMDLYNNGIEITQKHLEIAAEYYRNDVVIWIQQMGFNFEKININAADCFFIGNFKLLSYFIVNRLKYLERSIHQNILNFLFAGVIFSAY